MTVRPLKKIILIPILLSGFFCFAQENDVKNVEGAAEKAEVKVEEKNEAKTEEKSEEKSEIDKRIDTLKYGLESDIAGLISTLIKDKDTSLSNEVFTLFNETRNVAVREKILAYFTAIKDPRLKDYCLSVLEDPYAEKSSTVTAVLNYVTELEIRESCPFILEIMKNDNASIDNYYNVLLNACGKLGGKPEADFLIEYMKEDTIPLAREQAVMKALGDLCVVETYDELVEIAQDEDKNSYVRMYALESASKMGKEEIVPILVAQFASSDPNLRGCVVRSAENFVSTESECEKLIADALKDNNQNVRLEAAKVCKNKKLESLIDSLIYRSKNDGNANVKYECYAAISAIKSAKSVEFLCEIINDKKQSETNRAKTFDAIFEHEVFACYADCKKLAFESLSDDKLKNLRYSIGKTLAKHSLPDFYDVCQKFLEHKDVATQGIGLDIYLKNKYSNLTQLVTEISQNDDKKASANSKKAKFVLEKAKIEGNAQQSSTESTPEENKAIENNPADGKPSESNAAENRASDGSSPENDAAEKK